MIGITVPHSNQYHLGACACCAAADGGVVEAVTVALGTHLCAGCVPRFMDGLRVAGAGPADGLTVAVKTHPARSRKGA